MADALLAPEAEQAVLGAALIAPRSLYEAELILSPTDFSTQEHRTLWQAFRRIARNTPDTNIDLVTLGSELVTMGGWDAVGGRAYVSSLLSEYARPGSVAAHANLVHEAAIRRRMLTSLHNAASECKGGADVSEIRARLIEAAAESVNGSAACSSLNIIDEIGNTPTRIFKSGFPTLDSMLDAGGLWPGELLLIIGETGYGKTQVAVNLAWQFAEWNKRNVYYAALEGTKQKILPRAIQAAMDLSRPELRQEATIQQAKERLNRMGDRIVWDDEIRDIHQLFAKLTVHRARFGLDIVIVDHISGLLSVPGYQGHEADAEMMRLFIQASKQLDCAFVLLAQRRKVSKPDLKDYQPHLDDILGSGAIRNTCQVIGWLVPEDREITSTRRHIINAAKMQILKNRDGITGHLRLWLNRTTQRVWEPSNSELEFGACE